MYDSVATDLRFVRITDPNTAVGTVVRFMMSEPAFAGLSFGEWARVLDGQVTRGHCGFAIDSYEQVVGFIGWALAPEARAEAWANHGIYLSDAECRDGDCMIINAWLAKDSAVNRFLLRSLRVVGVAKKTAYFRRNYRGGTSRVVRLSINKFVAGHIARASNQEPTFGGSRDASQLATGVEERPC